VDPQGLVLPGLTLRTCEGVAVAEFEPMVNQWYRNLQQGYQFHVVARDEQQETVQIQYFDGDLEELDLEAWNEMELEPIEPPEDWTGSIDKIEPDDLGYTDTGMTPEEYGKQPQEGLSEEAEQEEGEDED
jgi:hypothetical protein